MNTLLVLIDLPLCWHFTPLSLSKNGSFLGVHQTSICWTVTVSKWPEKTTIPDQTIV